MYKFRVKELREKSEMTQQQVAIMCEMNLTTYINIEKNRVSSVKTETLFNLKKAFKLDKIDDLYDELS